MNKIIVNVILQLIVSWLFLNCGNSSEREEKAEKKKAAITIFIGEILCQTPGAIDIGRILPTFALAQGRQCLTNVVAEGLITNADTNAVITGGEITASPVQNLSCHCPGKIIGYGSWYKSPVSNPANGQKVSYIFTHFTKPAFTQYKAGDILYCIPTDDCPNTTHQKLIVK